ncbi:MAG: NFACT RNA binding domain-containing protein [Selenomonadaceae bacterium]|nr:NFACT RNA binding domain-containing protein [Selenomonadaceae bacterium]
MSLDGFSMRPLAMELDSRLAGGRIDKITQPNKQTVQLLVRQPGSSYCLCISISPQNPIVYCRETPFDSPSEPPVFCMVLRKQIESGRIASIRQHGLDRIIIIDIDFLGAGSKIITKSLVCELMGKYSNLILVTDGIITDSLRKVGQNSSRVRTVLPGDSYLLPPDGERLDPLTTPADEIIQQVKSAPGSRLDKALIAACQGFGPVTAREIAYSAGLAATMSVEDLEDMDFRALSDSFAETVKAVSADNVRPCIILDASGKLIAQSAFPLHYFTGKEAPTPPLFFDSLSALAEKAGEIIGSYVPPDKDRFQKIVRGEAARLQNKIAALKEELTQADNAEVYRINADNLQTYRYSLKDHADDEVTVNDIYGSREITIPLDKKLTIGDNIQSLYKKYAKLKRGRELMREQIALAEENLSYMLGLENSLEASALPIEIEDIRNELISAGLLKEKIKKRPFSQKASEPFSFTSPDGVKILVGKNNSQNDRLTFKIAQKDDIWLHTKDIPGSHVIIRLTEAGLTPDLLSEATLLYAARLAVQYSQAKGSTNVPVDYTRARYVKKPSGAKPGFVIFTNQKTIAVSD